MPLPWLWTLQKLSNCTSNQDTTIQSSSRHSIRETNHITKKYLIPRGCISATSGKLMPSLIEDLCFWIPVPLCRYWICGTFRTDTSSMATTFHQKRKQVISFPRTQFRHCSIATDFIFSKNLYPYQNVLNIYHHTLKVDLKTISKA